MTDFLALAQTVSDLAAATKSCPFQVSRLTMAIPLPWMKGVVVA